ncbi:MAG: hypothetical protein AAFX01_05535 [Cyanobacteria bacterium J06638_28]
MASSPRQQKSSRSGSRSRPSAPARIPTGLLCLTGILYAAAGLMMASFPAPYWIWNLALGGTIAQCLALAGPRSLRQFRWWSANFLALVAIVGTGAVAIGIAIALSYMGTDNLEAIVPQETLFEVLRSGFLALMVAAFGAIASAETGDRLLRLFNRLQTTVVLSAVCILGLGFGGLIGVFVVAA